MSLLVEPAKRIILLLPALPLLPPSFSSVSSLFLLSILFSFFVLSHTPLQGYGHSYKVERPQSRWQPDHNHWYIPGKVHRPGDTEPLRKQDSFVQSGYTKP